MDRPRSIVCELRAHAALDIVRLEHTGCLGSFWEDARVAWMARKAESLVALRKRNAYIARYDAVEAQNPLRHIEWAAVLEGRLHAEAAMRQAERLMQECSTRAA